MGAVDLYARNGENAVFIQDDIHMTAETVVKLLCDDRCIKNMQSDALRSIEPFNPTGYGSRILKAAGIAG